MRRLILLGLAGILALPAVPAGPAAFDAQPVACNDEHPYLGGLMAGQLGPSNREDWYGPLQAVAGFGVEAILAIDVVYVLYARNAQNGLCHAFESGYGAIAGFGSVTVNVDLYVRFIWDSPVDPPPAGATYVAEVLFA